MHKNEWEDVEFVDLFAFELTCYFIVYLDCRDLVAAIMSCYDLDFLSKDEDSPVHTDEQVIVKYFDVRLSDASHLLGEQKRFGKELDWLAIYLDGVLLATTLQTDFNFPAFVRMREFKRMLHDIFDAFRYHSRPSVPDRPIPIL